MKWVRVAGLVLVLSGFGGVETVSARAEEPARQSDLGAERCDEAGSQAETYGCYLNLARVSAVKVQREYERGLKIAIARDKAFNADMRGTGMLGSFLARRLRQSQVAWLQYAKAQCAYEGGSSFGGSGEDILDSACHYRLNLSRLAELRAAREQLER